MSGLGAVDPDGIGIVDGEGEDATLWYAQSAAPGLVRRHAKRVWYGTFSPLGAGWNPE